MAIQIQNDAPDTDAIYIITPDGSISIWRDENESIHVDVTPSDSTPPTKMVLGRPDDEG